MLPFIRVKSLKLTTMLRTSVSCMFCIDSELHLVENFAFYQTLLVAFLLAVRRLRLGGDDSVVPVESLFQVCSLFLRAFPRKLCTRGACHGEHFYSWQYGHLIFH